MAKGKRKHKEQQIVLQNNRNSPFERILASYMDDPEDPDRGIELSKKDLEIKERWENAGAMLLEWDSPAMVATMLMNKYGLSRATAFKDIANSMALFGNFNALKKEGMRFLLWEYNHKILKLALKQKNLDQVGKALERMYKLSDLDKEEPDFDPEKIRATEIHITIPGTQLKFIDNLAKKGVVDLLDYQAEDIEFEEIPPEDAS